jgi:hypothetical protein
MMHAFIVYIHLIATCAAIGTIVSTDLRLLVKVLGYRVVLPKPERFETVMISVALVTLYVTGAALVWLGLQGNPNYLDNQKLQAKLMLVALLTVNAFFLHLEVFPILELSKPVSRWSYLEWTTVAAGVSLSNCIWMFCAFLGIARSWNNVVSLTFVLYIAVACWAVMFVMVNTVLLLASRNQPKRESDWLDSLKAYLNRLVAPKDQKPQDVSASDRSKPGLKHRTD